MECPIASRSEIVRALTATRAPRWASILAVDAPIPLEAPVIKATRSRNIIKTSEVDDFAKNRPSRAGRDLNSAKPLKRLNSVSL
jgi:hypothetical protein